MLLGNMLLALAWAALQGEISLATLLTGHVIGYLVLLSLVKGGVLPPSPYVGKVYRATALGGFFLWELVRANLRLALDVAGCHPSTLSRLLHGAERVKPDDPRIVAVGRQLGLEPDECFAVTSEAEVA